MHLITKFGPGHIKNIKEFAKLHLLDFPTTDRSRPMPVGASCKTTDNRLNINKTTAINCGNLLINSGFVLFAGRCVVPPIYY